MNRNITYKITEYENGWNVERFLKSKGYSKPIIVHLNKTLNGIMVNNIWSYTRTVLNADDILKIKIIEDKPSENIVPSPISIDEFKDMTVYEDDDILVVNKSASMAVHPSVAHYENTLANYCAYYYLKYCPDDGEFVFRCINRLDRDTSGLVLIAKNMLSGAILAKQVQNREIRRTYLAIAEGKVPKSGRIELPIARLEEGLTTRCVDIENGERAVTNYECVSSFEIDLKTYSLVKLNLETGRTHQIRVHMKAIGHPLIGDFIYNPDYLLINRQALHSYSLEFVHPITGKNLLFEQNPPQDFARILGCELTTPYTLPQSGGT